MTLQGAKITDMLKKEELEECLNHLWKGKDSSRQSTDASTKIDDAVRSKKCLFLGILLIAFTAHRKMFSVSVSQDKVDVLF